VKGGEGFRQRWCQPSDGDTVTLMVMVEACGWHSHWHCWALRCLGSGVGN
jgi:hypothetical protein